MKKLIVALMVLSTLASCGKDNKVASAPAPAVANPATTAITTTDAAGLALADQVTKYTTSFGIARVSYYGAQYSIQHLVDNGVKMDLIYVKNNSSSTPTSDPNCETKWYIFTVCKSTTSSTLPANAVTVDVNYTSPAAKQDEIRNIINNKNPLIPIATSKNMFYGGTIYKIVAKDGKQFIIDTSHPIQANPIGTATPGANNTFAVEYLYTVKFK